MSKLPSRSRPAATLAVPTDEDGWRALRAELHSAFTPGAPIDAYDLFAGRQGQIQRLCDAVTSKGRHAVLFGERGVGKTSLSNIFYFGLQSPERVVYVYVQCGSFDTFEKIWAKALRRIVFHIDGQEYVAIDLVKGEITPDELEVVLANFPKGLMPVIVFDEFDRVKNSTVSLLMSETVKHFSNSPISSSIVIVGVADSVTDLIQEHHSVSRALVQIRMPRMDADEIKQIVTGRLRGTPISITSDALWRITVLASGLPFYAHALGRSSALLAVKKRVTTISEDLVNESISASFDDLDQTLIDSYTKAITETRKGNIFKQVLAACALAEQDDLGRFSAAGVESILSQILGKTMNAPSFSFHLNQLCEDARGLVLSKTGSRSHFRFRFQQPMIQPYVIMRSLSGGIISDRILEEFANKRQRSLPI